MDFYQLTLFQKIAERGNITKVAQEMGTSQPALSNMIKRIEDEVGEKLFVRQGKNLFLNKQGKIFLDTAYNMQKTINRTLLSLREESSLEGNIVITMTIPNEKMFDMIHHFHLIHPNITFTLYSPSLAPDNLKLSSSEFLLVLEHEADFSASIPFDIQKTLFAILPQNHPMASKTYLTLPELKQEYFVFIKDRRLNKYELCYNECISSGFTPNVSVSTETLLEKYACIREGCGIGIAYEQQISLPSHMDGFKVVPMQSISPQRTICLTWKEERLTVAGKLFIHFIQENLDNYS